MLFWSFGSKTFVKKYLKFKVNFFERFVSKYIAKIICGSVSYIKYDGIWIRRFKNNSTILVSNYFIFCFYIIFTSYNVFQ